MDKERLKERRKSDGIIDVYDEKGHLIFKNRRRIDGEKIKRKEKSK